MTDVMRAEWLKLRSVRSTVWTLCPAVVIGAGLSYLFGLGFRAGFSDMSRERQEDFDPLYATFYSLTLAQLALVVFAVLVMGSEFSTGTIRAALSATPRRGVFYAGKVAASAVPIAAISVVTVVTAFVTAQAALGPHSTSFGAAGSAAAIAGAWVYLVLISAFAMGVTAMLRSSVRALAVLLPVFFLGSQGLGNVPEVKTFAQYLPDQAGMVLMYVVGPAGDPQFGRDYGPWTALVILVAWTAAALIGGYVMLRRHDA